MQDQLAEILFYVKGTLKYRWVIIIVAWLICITGWGFVTTMPDEFESKALVKVDSNTMLRPLLRGMTIQSNTGGLIAVMRQLMFTRPKLEKVAELSDFELESKDEAEIRAIIEKLKKGIKIRGAGNNLFTIAYNGERPKQAQSIVHAVLTVFSAQTQQRGGRDTTNAQQFIEEQIREYEVRLQNAEKARENFKRVNSGFLPSQGGGGLGALSSMKQQMEEAQMALQEINSRERVLNEQIDEALEMEGEGEDEWGLGGDDMGGGQVSTPEDPKIAALQERINELLLRYTENHPDVLSLKTTIQDYEKARQERLDSMPEEDQSMMSSEDLANPYIQSLKMSLNQAQAQRASILSRISLLNKRIDDVQKGMDTRLRIETELSNLDRDYGIIKSNYMKLLGSRETAVLTEAADLSQGVLKFKIIEVPTAPLEPTGPNRKLLNSTFLGLGLAAGFVLAFLIYFIRPTFMSSRQLRAVTGLPVLGSVGVQLHAGEVPEKLKPALFWSMVIGLLLIYTLAMANVFSGEGVKQLMKLISL